MKAFFYSCDDSARRFDLNGEGKRQIHGAMPYSNDSSLLMLASSTDDPNRFQGFSLRDSGYGLDCAGGGKIKKIGEGVYKARHPLWK